MECGLWFYLAKIVTATFTIHEDMPNLSHDYCLWIVMLGVQFCVTRSLVPSIAKKRKEKKRALYHQIELIDWLVTLFHFGLFSLCGDYGGLK
jgi:hypothetical protein